MMIHQRAKATTSSGIVELPLAPPPPLSKNSAKRRRKSTSTSLTCLICAFLLVVGVAFVALKDDTKSKEKQHEERLESNLEEEEELIEYEEGDDATDRFDFNGGGKMSQAYRIGDVFCVWYTRWMKWRKVQEFYHKKYPNTLADLYLREVKEEDLAMRNITALLRVMDKKEREGAHFRRARPEELVVHLRLGDVITDEEYHEIDISMKEIWERPYGYVDDSNCKMGYNKLEYTQILGWMPKHVKDKAKKCVFVGAAGFLGVKENANREEEYIQYVTEFFKERLGCEIEFYSSKNPDKDLMFLASAYNIVTAMGGYAQIAAGCVTARRGWGHAFYNFFDGSVTGDNDSRFSDEKYKYHRRFFIDWRDVDLEQTMRDYDKNQDYMKKRIKYKV